MKGNVFEFHPSKRPYQIKQPKENKTFLISMFLILDCYYGDCIIMKITKNTTNFVLKKLVTKYSLRFHLEGCGTS